MEIYYFIMGILVLLAVLDLTVGISNDAVNFLNSAIGANVAPRHIILIIASLGILAGVTFSGGMMEVARKGIFFPGKFFMPELMIIFLGVMLTDVLLLDTFNTVGLPTSTTVSIVFELLGAAVALSIAKILQMDGNLGQLGEYINSGRALVIIMGILLSVVVAFTIGGISMFFTRLVFTFEYKQQLKRYGAIFGSVALTAIVFFILIKGAKGATFMTAEMKQTISDNSLMIMVISFVFWTVFLKIWQMVSSFEFLKIVILVGTFALAMAFAANDLVNFVGVPLAGIHAFTLAQTLESPTTTLMTGLEGKIQTETILLLLAGVVMVITLWLSRKARTVTKTEINLARQDEGDERFGSTLMSRVLVRANNNFVKGISSITPAPIRKFVSSRFTQVSSDSKNKEKPAFDLLRASVNLSVASVIISFATSLKLPLSTTYVTFMVAMGSSLADRAWGRESAVYRVNGVLTVVAGWFATAFIAFTVALIMTFIIFYTGTTGIIILILLSAWTLWRLHLRHKNKYESETGEVEREVPEDTRQAVEYYTKRQIKTIKFLGDLYDNSIQGLFERDLKKLKEQFKSLKNFETNINKLIKAALQDVRDFEEDSNLMHDNTALGITTANNILFNIKEIVTSNFKHFDNQHTPLAAEQIGMLKTVLDLFTDFISILLENYNNYEEGSYESMRKASKEIRKEIRAIKKKMLKLMKQSDLKTRQTLLSLHVLEHSEQLLVSLTQLYKIGHYPIDIEEVE